MSDLTIPDHAAFGVDRSRYDGGRHFVAYWHFVGWDCLSLGLHVSLVSPNMELHLPFGFIRIGWVICPDIRELHVRPEHPYRDDQSRDQRNDREGDETVE